MDDSINLSISSLPEEDNVGASYKKAAKHFLNKSFDKTYETLRPLLDLTPAHERVWTKVWSLYLAILDKAVTDNSGLLDRKTRRELTAKAQSIAVWDEVETAFGGLEQLDPDLLVSLVSLSTRHATSKDDLKTVSKKLELYIAAATPDRFSVGETSAYKPLMAAYALKVLPLLDEYDYATEFIDLNPFIENKTLAHQKLADAKLKIKKQDQERVAEEQRLKKLEQQRVVDAEKQHILVPTLTETNNSSTSLLPVAPSPIPSSPPREGSSSPRSPRSSPAARQRPRDLQSLYRYWKGYVNDLLQSASFLRLLLFFVAVILAVSNPNVRDRLRRVLAGLWAKLVQTLRMGTKVSYV